MARGDGSLDHFGRVRNVGGLLETPAGRGAETSSTLADGHGDLACGPAPAGDPCPPLLARLAGDSRQQAGRRDLGLPRWVRGGRSRYRSGRISTLPEPVTRRAVGRACRDPGVRTSLPMRDNDLDIGDCWRETWPVSCYSPKVGRISRNRWPISTSIYRRASEHIRPSDDPGHLSPVELVETLAQRYFRLNRAVRMCCHDVVRVRPHVVSFRNRRLRCLRSRKSVRPGLYRDCHESFDRCG